MRKRRYSQIQWGQTGRQRQASTLSGATPFREGGSPRAQSFGHAFHAGLHRTVLELDQAESLTREFLLGRAKRGDAFAARLLRDRYRLRVATAAEVRHENQRRAHQAQPEETGAGDSKQAGPAVQKPEARIDDGAGGARC
jgi:hypothetical protein